MDKKRKEIEEDPTSVDKLDLSKSELETLPDLSNCTNLRRLDVSGNLLTDFEGIESNTELTWLCGNANQVSSISHLVKMRDLVVLSLNRNQLKEFETPLKCEQLASLSLAYNQIATASYVAAFLNLNTLVLSHNQLTHFKFVEGLTLLRKLSLSHNQIKEWPRLDRLSELRELRLNRNLLTAFPPEIACLGALKVLDVGHNKMLTFSSFEHLREIKHLKSLNCAGNPLVDTKDYDRNILSILPQLKIFDSRQLTSQKKEMKIKAQAWRKYGQKKARPSQQADSPARAPQSPPSNCAAPL